MWGELPIRPARRCFCRAGLKRSSRKRRGHAAGGRSRIDRLRMRPPSGVRLKDGRVLRAPTSFIPAPSGICTAGCLTPAQTTADRGMGGQTGPDVSQRRALCRRGPGRDPDGTAPSKCWWEPGQDRRERGHRLHPQPDDTTCAVQRHTVLAIGPTFENWDTADGEAYRASAEGAGQTVAVLEKRFPRYRPERPTRGGGHTPTIERYTMKNGGAVAGPKQMLGQHMFKGYIPERSGTIFCCGSPP
jgi:hypothetical protein